MQADRDDRTLQYAKSKAVGRERQTPVTPGGHRDRAWGGGLQYVADTRIYPNRDDEYRVYNKPGNYVPFGYGQYINPTLDPYDYQYFRMGGWRVVVPRDLSGKSVADLLATIDAHGPQAVGYVRLGDTLVPGTLNPGDRATLAQSAVDYPDYPLSP